MSQFEYKNVAEAVAAAEAALAEAEAMADQTGKGFHFSPAYGMGGYYDPEDECDETASHWFPSSVGC